MIFHVSTYSIWEFSNPTDTSAKNVMLCGSFTELAEWNYLCIYTLYYFAFNIIIHHPWYMKIDSSGANGLSLPNFGNSTNGLMVRIRTGLNARVLSLNPSGNTFFFGLVIFFVIFYPKRVDLQVN